MSLGPGREALVLGERSGLLSRPRSSGTVGHGGSRSPSSRRSTTSRPIKGCSAVAGILLMARALTRRAMRRETALVAALFAAACNPAASPNPVPVPDSNYCPQCAKSSGRPTPEASAARRVTPSTTRRCRGRRTSQTRAARSSAPDSRASASSSTRSASCRVTACAQIELPARRTATKHAAIPELSRLRLTVDLSTPRWGGERARWGDHCHPSFRTPSGWATGTSPSTGRTS